METTIQTQQDLQSAIEKLEDQQLANKNALQQHFHESYQSIKPVNIIKNTVSEINDAGELKKAILKAAVVLAIGYVTKRLINAYVIKSKGSVTAKIGGVVQLLISAWVARNGRLMKNIALHFFKIIISNRSQQPQLQLPVAINR